MRRMFGHIPQSLTKDISKDTEALENEKLRQEELAKIEYLNQLADDFELNLR